MPRIAELELNQINRQFSHIDQLLKQMQDVLNRIQRLENFTSPIAKGNLSTGFGNGASGTAMTTTAQGTGTGPTQPQTIVKHLRIHLGNEVFWLPLVK